MFDLDEILLGVLLTKVTLLFTVQYSPWQFPLQMKYCPMMYIQITLLTLNCTLSQEVQAWEPSLKKQQLKQFKNRAENSGLGVDFYRKTQGVVVEVGQILSLLKSRWWEGVYTLLILQGKEIKTTLLIACT